MVGLVTGGKGLQCDQRYDTHPIHSDSSSGGRLARALFLACRGRLGLLRLLRLIDLRQKNQTSKNQTSIQMTPETITLERPFAFGDTVTDSEGRVGRIGGTNYENGTLLVTWLKDDEAQIIPMSSVTVKSKASATKSALSSFGFRFAS